MKVLVLSSLAFTLVKFRSDMMKEMVSRGCKVYAAAPDSEEEWKDRLSAIGVEYNMIFVDRNGTNPFKDIKTLLSIIWLIKKIQPDAVFLYQAKTVIYGAIAAKLYGVKGIFALIAGLGSAYRAQGLKGRLIKIILSLQYKIALGGCNKIFLQNKDDISELSKARIIKDGQVIMINGSGVNLDEFKPSPLPNEDSFLFVGRLIKDKGIMEYLKAAEIVKAKYANAKFRLVGFFDTNPTAIKPDCIKRYQRAGIVEYCGFVNDVRPFLRQTRVFVLPSYHEGTPKSVLEAMAMGRAIITTDAPGCRETVINGVNGFLVPPKDYKDLAAKMVYLIENGEECQAMGQASFEYCQKRFDVQKVNETVLKVMGITSGYQFQEVY